MKVPPSWEKEKKRMMCYLKKKKNKCCVNGILLFYRIVTVPTSKHGQTTTLCRAMIMWPALEMTAVQMVSVLEHHSRAFRAKSVIMTHAV